MEWDLRDGLFAEGVTELDHYGMHSRPVVADLVAILIALNHGNTQISLCAEIPLVSGRHGDASEEESIYLFDWSVMKRIMGI